MEDNAIAEAQQLGHQSGPLPSGRFGPREYCVHRFDKLGFLTK